MTFVSVLNHCILFDKEIISYHLQNNVISPKLDHSHLREKPYQCYFERSYEEYMLVTSESSHSILLGCAGRNILQGNCYFENLNIGSERLISGLVL